MDLSTVRALTPILPCENMRNQSLLLLVTVPTDVIEYIMPRLTDQTRTRRSILKQLKWLGIIETSKDLQPAKAP